MLEYYFSLTIDMIYASCKYVYFVFPICTRACLRACTRAEFLLVRCARVRFLLSRPPLWLGPIVADKHSRMHNMKQFYLRLAASASPTCLPFFSYYGRRDGHR